MRAATRNVLSPISEKMIIVKASIKEWKGCMAPSSTSSSVEEGVLGGELVSRGSLVEMEPGTGRGLSCRESGRSVGFCRLVSTESTA
jgi:hypothetical protein